MFAIQIANQDTFYSNLISQENILNNFLKVFPLLILINLFINLLKLIQFRALLEHETNIQKHKTVAVFTYREDIYILNNTRPPLIFVTSDLHLRENTSFERDLSEIGHSQPTAEIIKELRKEMNDDEIDVSKLCNFKNKFSRSVSLKFKKEDLFYQLHFPG